MNTLIEATEDLLSKLEQAGTHRPHDTQLKGAIEEATQYLKQLKRED